MYTCISIFIRISHH